MAALTLTKAARLQDRIRAAVRALPLRGHVSLNIFAPETGALVEREAASLRKSVDQIERLLAILATIRAATGRANAECGIAGLLAEDAALQEEGGLLSKLLPTPVDAEDPEGLFRTPRRPQPPRHAGAVEEQVRAMRARYEHAESGKTTLEAPLVDDAGTERLRARMLACRRRIEEIGDRLRELNGTVRVEIDEALAYLRAQEVI